jgi:outer membrane protein TolC
MRLFWTACLLCILACAALPLTAAQAQVVPLQDLEASALAHRPEQDVGHARVSAANAQIDRAEVGYMPLVSVGANASIAPGRTLVTVQDKTSMQSYLVSGTRALGDPGAFTPLPRYGATIDLRGSLYDFGRTGSAVDAANAQKDAANADARVRAEQLLRDVRGAYVRWAGAYALWQLAGENVTGADAREKRVAALIEEGARPAVDKTVAAQQTAAARIDAERAEEQVDAARLDLGYAAAKDLAPNAEPDLSLLADTNSTPSGEASKASQLAEEAIARAHSAAEARARMQEHSRAPVLGYDADTGILGQFSNVFPVYSVGVNLTVPLFDGGAAKAGAAEAHAQAAELSAQAASESARTKYAAERVQVASAHAARRLALASESLRWADAQIEQLQSNTSLDAETFQALTSAELARARARSEVVLAQVACAQARFGLIAP